MYIYPVLIRIEI